MGGPAFVDGETFVALDNFNTNYYFIYGNVDGEPLVWDSSERAFQALKFLDITTCERPKSHPNYSHFMKIYLAKSVEDAFRLGQSREFKLRDDWEDAKANVMYVVCFEKVVQNFQLLEDLVGTSGSINFYGSTDYWNEKNREIYEHIRDIFKSKIKFLSSQM